MMKIRAGIVAAIALLVTLAAWASAQQFLQDRAIQTPTTLSGDDVGFRVEGVRAEGDGVVGRLVVRVNGKWVDAHIGGGGLRRLTAK
jgi:hypothetical protein